MKDKNLETLLVGLAIVILILQVVFLVRSWDLGSGGAGGPSNLGYVTISAAGTASAKPTSGSLSISISGRGKTGQSATANLSQILAEVNSTLLKYINGNTTLIKTTYYNLYNQTSYYPYGYNTYNGFVATEQLTVTIPNIQNVSAAVGALSLINNTEVTDVSATLSYSQISALRTQAFKYAMQNATSQASVLTNNAQLSVQNITVNSYNFYPIPYALGAGSVSNQNSTINPGFYSGTTSITESVTVVFSYQK